ncbi:MAG: CotH kinase family protein [Paludibacteraceae bacterium]|nr:CotH kinase family protein [Paludibacteraceae bacterium]
MKKSDWLKVWVLLSCYSGANAELRITEIMTNNVSTIYSDKYNYDGYVEFFNDGDEVDLKGWTVTNIKQGKTDWSLKLDSTHILPRGYSLLFFGKSETSSLSASKVQHNYVGRVGHKLSTDEGSLYFEKEGVKLELAYPGQYPHLSYCADGYMMPTPGKENDPLTTAIANRVASPSFKSGEPGLYEEVVNVELACETEGAVIYYTLNGDVPSPETGLLYEEAVSIEKTTSLRARAYKDGMLFSEILTGSYIFPDKYHNACKGDGKRLPVVSLSANQKDIYDDMLGIYVEGKNGIANSCTPVANYNQDWMRSANFEYMVDGKVVDCQEVEIGVYGGCTRIHVGKSLKIKANKRSGKNRMNYNSFFASRSYKKYKSLALRNGGNGYSYVQPRWRDMFIQSLADGMNIDKQAAQPVSFYLNGEYYGMMILTERTDEDYVYHNYGLDEDEIDMLSGNGGYVCEVGTKEAYDNMIDYVSKSYSDADFYDKLNTHMDVDEYVDYQILQQYVGNTDWVTNNTKLWRKHDGGRFRWILYDTDFGLSPRSSALDTCMLDFTTKPIKTHSNVPLVLMQSCMKNEDFRWKFLDQYLDRIENQFTDERIDTNLDSLWNMTDFEMCATIKHSDLLSCPGNFDTYHEEIETMRSFAKERKKYVIDQLKREFGLGDELVSVKVRAVFPGEETPDFDFLLNKRAFSGVKYNTSRYSNERVKLEPTIPFGYKILRWEINNEVVRTDDGSKYLEKYLTTVANSGELKITIYFEHDPNSTLPEKLYLNEICASNESTLDETGEASDWIELYNGSDKAIDLAGMTIENVTKVVKCTIPSGYEETVVPAHGYKLLWADKKTELGPLHLNFKLGVTASENIVLRTSYHDAEVELSRITYTPHNPDESYGRETDGASSMKLFAKCVDDEGTEFMTSTPLAENGSIGCSTLNVTEEIVDDTDSRQVFAQGKRVYVWNAKGGDVRVYSLLGDMVANRKSDSDRFVLTIPVPGVYLVKVERKCWKVVVE